MVRKEIFGILIGMAGGYPIDGKKPEEKRHEIKPGKGHYGLYIAIMAVLMAVIVVGVVVFMAQTPVKDEVAPPPEAKTAEVTAENAVNTAATSVQETTNTAGIPVSVVASDFYEAEEWKLNTLYIDPERPGYGTLLVRMKDIEYLQPFRIANAEYSNFRLEKHERDAFGFVGELRADAIVYEENVGARLGIQVFDKLPQGNSDGVITNGAITLFTSDGRLEKLPPSNSVLRIVVTQ